MIFKKHNESNKLFIFHIKKLLILSFVLSIAGIVVIIRIFEVSTKNSYPVNQVKKVFNNENSVRGKIKDRNGRVLASNIYTYKLIAYPNSIKDLNHTIINIKKQFPELNSKSLKRKLNDKKKVEVLLKKNIIAPDAKRINSLGIPGIYFKKDLKRFYPHKNLTSHIVGHINDNKSGVYGAEKTFNDKLSNGEEIHLSIDLRVQHAVKEELLKGFIQYQSKSATAIIINLESSEILSLVSLPDFNPNQSINPKKNSYRNTATLNLYEMGSTFKIFTIAAALELSDVSLSSSFDATAPLRISNFIIKDYHPENRILTTKEIFLKSSNIGSSLIAKEIGVNNLKNFYNKIGILDFSRINLAEKSKPILPRRWGDIEVATLSFGHGISISPISMVEAASVIFNRKQTKGLTIKKENNELKLINNLISENTRKKLIKLMEENVLFGTGKRAALDEYKIGGKTATGEKPASKGYDENKLVSSFLSIFPVDQPRFMSLVLYDEPSIYKTNITNDNVTGGTTAAPVTASIIKRIAPVLGLTKKNKIGFELMVKNKNELNFASY